ncbi:DNA repair RAD5 [Fusarium phyllophilum]|uniref:DNA repair RAD5 n=1 Tax=Fusarium phyllophilum TaxID=47803 RepID=A0A8H5IPH7_9HYPO|nr:DNA repair RAD5 [Fusarium phyllophilum]
MAFPVGQRLIKKEEEDSNDECTFLSSSKKGDSKKAICIDDDEDDDEEEEEEEESTSGLFPRPREASGNGNLNIVKDESDEEKENFKMKGLKPQIKDAITAGDFCDKINVDPESSDEDTDDEYDPDSAHEKDSDYHDSDASDDSDESDDSETQQKKHKLKRGGWKASDIRKVIKKWENEKNALLLKQYMGEKLSPVECEKLEKRKEKIPKAQKALEKYARESPPKTAREYWQRHLKRQEEKEDRKRKRNGSETNPNKLQKTDMQAGPFGGVEHPGYSRAAALFTTKGAQDDNGDDSEPANRIEATTHEVQMKQIMAGIPEGNDTRHTNTQKKDLMKAKKCFGYKQIKAIDGKWKLKGMETSMHSQQLVAATWMVRREAMGLIPAGGILADEMGLGKTITSLATIVGHPAEPEDREDGYGRATLVIADSAQSASRTWMDQIKKHTSKKFAKRCLIYSKELEKDARWWSTKNVVITNLNALRGQFPSKKERKLLKAQWAGDEAGYQQAISNSLGELFDVNWYRIILDEAHGIKNHTSSGALAVWELNAKYRWALTGTPLANKLEEFYPYLKFIGCHFATTMRRYRAEYIRSDQASENFETLVALVMMRRQQTEKFLGHTMVPLPKSHRSDIWIPCAGWEKILEEVVDDAYQEKLQDAQNENQETAEDEHQQQQDIEENEVESDDESEADFESDENNGSNALDTYRIQLLRCTRLLQLTSHPLTLETFYREKDHDVYIDKTLERLKSEITQSNLDADQKALEASLEPAYSSGLRQLELVIKDNFGGSEEMTELLTLAANEHKVKDVTCAYCHQRTPPTNPVQSSNCEHIYCHNCLSIAVNSKTKTGRIRVLQAPQCQITGCSPKLGMGQAVKTLGCIDTAVKAINGYKEPGRDSIGTRWTGGTKDLASFFRAVCGRDDIDYGPVRMPLSSKVKATLAVMLTWMEEAPDDKIILFVQWTRTAKALGCVLESLGIKFLYYNRMANQKQKTRALDEFTNNADTKILVSSMKCGGQSLNLQMANRVIILDEWWNKAAEEQAFKRVYRTGQLKETHLVRIIAKDSIDERIIMLQDAKEEIIRAALQDGEMQPNFSNYLQLQMLFSGKDKQTLIAEMETEARARQAKQ